MNLKEFFDSIDSNTIKGFVEARRQEDLHLDFKTAPKGLDKEARRNVAKAVSGFANSDGGIVVWGISARKVDEVDAADQLDPIRQLAKFVSDLNSFTGQFVSPLVDGVEHRVIPDPSLQDSGYVITLVPVSNAGPHMAKGGEDRYYKRSGDSFYRLEHYEVADLFGRRPHASLSLHCRPTFHDRRVSVEVGIVNSGRGMARFPYLELEVNSPFRIGSIGVTQKEGVNGMGTILVPRFSEQHRGFAASGHPVIYPQGMLLIAKVELKVPEIADYTIPDLDMSYTLCCEGLPVHHGKHTILGTDLKSAPSD